MPFPSSFLCFLISQQASLEVLDGASQIIWAYCHRLHVLQLMECYPHHFSLALESLLREVIHWGWRNLAPVKLTKSREAWSHVLLLTS